MDTPELNGPLNLFRAAEYLGIAKGTLYQLVHYKKIAYYKPSGKLLYFRKEDLDAYAFQCRVSADFEVNHKAEAILNRK